MLVHGFLGGSAQWALEASLSEGRALVAVDLPGFGKNADLAPEPSIAALARWVLNHVTAPRFDLLGHSMGGMVVQEMVRHAPERVNKLVLYGTGSIGDMPGRFAPMATSQARAKSAGAAATARRIAATWLKDGTASPAYPAIADIAEQASMAAMLAGFDAMQAWSGKDHLPHIAAETLVLWGELDRSYNWSQTEVLWQNIPNSHLAVLPHAAHAVHCDQPQLFNGVVTDFLHR